jgi:hypothetical protein
MTIDAPISVNIGGKCIHRLRLGDQTERAYRSTTIRGPWRCRRDWGWLALLSAKVRIATMTNADRVLSGNGPIRNRIGDLAKGNRSPRPEASPAMQPRSAAAITSSDGLSPPASASTILSISSPSADPAAARRAA